MSLHVEVPGAGPIMRPRSGSDVAIDGFVLAPYGCSDPKAIIFVPVECEDRDTFEQAGRVRPIGYKLTPHGKFWFHFSVERPRLVLADRLHWLALLLFDDADSILTAGEAAQGKTLVPQIVAGIADSPEIPEDDTIQAAVAQAIATRPTGELTRGLMPRTWTTGTVGERPATDALTFVVGSCRYPPGLLDRTPSRAPILLKRMRPDARRPTPLVGSADQVLARLLERFRGEASHPQLLLLLGDQIYADATAGLFNPAMLTEAYRSQYRTLFGDGFSRLLFNQFERVHFMLDDHEISDNWEPDCIEAEVAARHLEKPLDAFLEAQLFNNPRAGDRYDFRFYFAYGGFHFHLLDTRTKREWRNATTWRFAQILDAAQWAHLETWLCGEEVRDQPVRFIGFPALLLPRHLRVVRREESGLREDNWDGYPASREKLLRMLIEKNIQNTVFLSGDEHIPVAANIVMTNSEDEKKKIRAYSFHCSAIHAPYPFANSMAEHFVDDDAFDIRVDDVPWKVEVTAAFPDVGDNVAIFTVDRQRMKVEFQGLHRTWEREFRLGDPIPDLRSAP